MDLKDPKNWAWMREHMPGTVAMMRREREGGGGALVNECWRRGVIEQEPGWFFARENGVSLGVPSEAFMRDPNRAAIEAMFPDRTLLMLRGAMVQPVQAPAPEPPRLTAKQQQGRDLVKGNMTEQWDAARAEQGGRRGAN